VLRAVLDANVYVSAAVHPGGPPGRIVERFLTDGAFEMIVSPAIVEEIFRALAYPKVRRHIRGDITPELWFEDILVLADMTPGERNLSRVCEDQDDDKYVAAALEGRAAFIVTGDRQFLALKAHEGVKVVTPRLFLTLLEAS
jgi:uncharacterized protein